jgi:SAM-dependent methyltransferase
MADVPDRSTFESAYAGQAPWDIGRPQRAFVTAADRVSGSVLDAGCGIGEHALLFALRGHRATGIDFLEEPIQRARLKAARRGLDPTFLVKDALMLRDWDDADQLADRPGGHGRLGGQAAGGVPPGQQGQGETVLGHGTPGGPRASRGRA